MINNLLNHNFIKKYHLFLFLFFFIVSRLIIHNFFQIEINGPNYGYHLLHVDFLKNDLLQSLLLLHSQPPLFNFIQGIFLKIFSNIQQIALAFNFFNSFLSLGIIYYSFLISNFFNINFKQKLFLLLILILNPSIIFYENLFSYHLLTTFLFIQISYFFFKYFFSKDQKYEIFIYLSLSLLCLTWGAFQPILIFFFYICFRCVDKIFSKKIFFYMTLSLLIALSPHIKNKIIFGSFTSSSWSGHGFSTVFINDWQEFCGHPLSKQNFYKEIYEKKYNKKFTHPSLVGPKAGFNNIGLIYKSPKCFSLTLNKINQEPYSYVKSRLLAFLASHGKFAFDFVYPNPSGWMKYYGFIKNAYQDKNIKLLRQILVFSLNMIIYAVMIYFIFFSNYNLNFKLSVFFIGLAYLYLFSVGFLFSCCEQERMLFTGYIKEVLFIIFLVKKYFKVV